MGLRSKLVSTAALIALGIFVPYWRGWSAIDPFFFIPFACLSIFLVAPILAREAPSTARNRIGRTVARACGAMAIVLIVALLALNAMHWTGQLLLPEPVVILDALVLSLCATAATAAILEYCGQRFPPLTVKWGFRVLMLAGVLVYRNLSVEQSIAWSRLVYEWGLTPFALGVSLLFAAIAALFLFALRRPIPIS